jgi:ABC-type polysaccharide/polyol phosphate transport system ATPase subunit
MVHFENVSKRFRMQYERSHTFQDLFVRGLGKVSRMAQRASRPDVVTILDNVSFSVGRGEALGIIGPNGAGKSTILKLASGIIYPDAGRISVQGRLAGLLELGAGFHPDLSGRENIYLYGSIIGLNRRTIEARLPDIVDFAGLSHFIDVPVKDYSSGMFMRLAFSVASSVDADVLLVDEVLSVGDAAFRQKSYQRVLDYKQRGGAILFVSHELAAVERLCERVLLLHGGRIIAEGPPRPVIEEYLHMSERSPQGDSSGGGGRVPRPVRIVAVELLDADGRAAQTFESGSPALLRIGLEASIATSSLVVRAMVYHSGCAGVSPGTLAHGTNSARHALRLDLEPGMSWVELRYHALDLIPGAYYLLVGVLAHELDLEYYDVRSYACPFEVTGSQELGGGLAALPHEWQKGGEYTPKKEE